jgi:hypothetical protein
MKREMILTHEFVEYIPDSLRDGMIYVSIAFATVAHRCCCGCGNEVITPISPTDWQLVFDGESISLDPSIGNWSFDCKSHYWIRRNRVKWAPRWSQKEIEAGRSHDRWEKERYFESSKTLIGHNTNASAGRPGESKSEQGLWRKLRKWFFSHTN